MQRVTFRTRKKREVLDITDTVEGLLQENHAHATGIVNLFILHTTAALTTADLDPGTDLDMLLRQKGIQNVVLAGITTDVCVHTTMREANDRGFRCIVLSDCCGSYFAEFHEMGLAMIKAQGGIFGSVSSSKLLLRILATAH